MNKVTQTLLGLAFVCLLLGMVLPWVQFAPPAEKANNLADLVSLLNRTESLPQVVQQYLQEHGWDAPRDLLGLQAFFAQDLALGETFSHMYERNQLFSWDFFRLPAAGITRFLILSLTALCLAAGIVSVYWFQQQASSLDLDDNDYLDNDSIALVSSPSGITFVLAVLAGSAVFLLFFFIVQLPLLDTLGRPGDRALSLAGLIVGAQITKTPRILLPVGLLAVFLAGFEAFLVAAARHGRSRITEDPF